MIVEYVFYCALSIKVDTLEFLIIDHHHHHLAITRYFFSPLLSK